MISLPQFSKAVTINPTNVKKRSMRPFILLEACFLTFPCHNYVKDYKRVLGCDCMEADALNSLLYVPRTQIYMFMM